MLAVATGDVIAVDPPGRTFLLVGYIGSVRSELVQPHIAGLVDDLSADCVACRIEVFGDRRLPIGHHLLAGEFLGVNEETRSTLPGNGRAVVGMPLDPFARPVRPPAAARRCRPPAPRLEFAPAHGGGSVVPGECCRCRCGEEYGTRADRPGRRR